MAEKQILLSGIQPSGQLHIGNYLGAIKQWVAFQKKYKEYIEIADLHAITVPQDPLKLRENTLKTAAWLFACGINPKRSTVFIQSQIPAHTELAWILITLTSIGELERMTQYKEKREKSGLFAGLLNYPVLQAADILLYRPDVVPVGEDQLQHLELARTLARKFNNRFGKVFKEPATILPLKEAARIMGLDDPAKKMSKSAASPNNYIALIDSPDEIRRKIKIAVTDSESEIKYNKITKPAISNLMTIYSAFSGLSFEKIEAKYKGRGYAEFKNDLAGILIEKIATIQKKYREFCRNEKRLKELLREGAKKAEQVANKTLLEAKRKAGFILF